MAATPSIPGPQVTPILIALTPSTDQDLTAVAPNAPHRREASPDSQLGFDPIDSYRRSYSNPPTPHGGSCLDDEAGASARSPDVRAAAPPAY